MAEVILDVKNIRKTYGTTKALNNVSFSVRRGEVYGLIGRNGAGKTTLMRIIAGLSFADNGDILLFGENSRRNQQLFERIGVLIEAPALYPQFSAFDNMQLKALALGLPDAKKKIEELLTLLQLDPKSKKKSKHFSLGMKQRLGIALALLGQPDLLLLDEPANGLDPEGIVDIRKTLLMLAKEKQMTILISSHILDELARTVSRIGIIEQGQLLEDLAMDELIERCRDRLEIITHDIDRAVNVLEDSFGFKQFKVTGPETIACFEGLSESTKINQKLFEAGVQVQSLAVHQESLEDYFMKRIGGEHRV